MIQRIGWESHTGMIMVDLLVSEVSTGSRIGGHVPVPGLGADLSV